MPVFLDRVRDTGETGVIVGGTVGFVVGSLRYWRTGIGLDAMLKVGGVGAYFGFAGGAVGVIAEILAQA